jgi:hypothetical protein
VWGGARRAKNVARGRACEKCCASKNIAREKKCWARRNMYSELSVNPNAIIDVQKYYEKERTRNVHLHAQEKASMTVSPTTKRKF